MGGEVVRKKQSNMIVVVTVVKGNDSKSNIFGVL